MSVLTLSFLESVSSLQGLFLYFIKKTQRKLYSRDQACLPQNVAGWEAPLKECQRNSPNTSCSGCSVQEQPPAMCELLWHFTLALWRCSVCFQTSHDSGTPPDPYKLAPPHPSCTLLSLPPTPRNHCGTCEFPSRCLY